MIQFMQTLDAQCVCKQPSWAKSNNKSTQTRLIDNNQYANLSLAILNNVFIC